MSHPFCGMDFPYRKMSCAFLWYRKLETPYRKMDETFCGIPQVGMVIPQTW